ncbi:putative transposase, Ptta/En/Spm, plant [Sesbania bispinosa]|nr:putative transposase, Ptta/En/Spm, plant [Sesbania bispinosa]
MGPTNFATIRAKLHSKKENGEDVSQAEMFVETRQSQKGKEVDQETQNAITKLQDSINSSSETAGEAFQSLFGKEKPGRVRCMGRTITPTMLKKNDEIAALKKQHSEEMSSKSKQLKGMEALLRCFMKQNNPDLDDEALDNMMGNAITPHSSGSTYIPNHNEVKLVVTYLSLVL